MNLTASTGTGYMGFNGGMGVGLAARSSLLVRGFLLFAIVYKYLAYLYGGRYFLPKSFYFEFFMWKG